MSLANHSFLSPFGFLQRSRRIPAGSSTNLQSPCKISLSFNSMAILLSMGEYLSLQLLPSLPPSILSHGPPITRFDRAHLHRSTLSESDGCAAWARFQPTQPLQAQWRRCMSYWPSHEKAFTRRSMLFVQQTQDNGRSHIPNGPKIYPQHCLAKESSSGAICTRPIPETRSQAIVCLPQLRLGTRMSEPHRDAMAMLGLRTVVSPGLIVGL